MDDQESFGAMLARLEEQDQLRRQQLLRRFFACICLFVLDCLVAIVTHSPPLALPLTAVGLVIWVMAAKAMIEYRALEQ